MNWGTADRASITESLILVFRDDGYKRFRIVSVADRI